MCSAQNWWILISKKFIVYLFCLLHKNKKINKKVQVLHKEWWYRGRGDYMRGLYELGWIVTRDMGVHVPYKLSSFQLEIYLKGLNMKTKSFHYQYASKHKNLRVLRPVPHINLPLKYCLKCWDIISYNIINDFTPDFVIYTCGSSSLSSSELIRNNPFGMPLLGTPSFV